MTDKKETTDEPGAVDESEAPDAVHEAHEPSVEGENEHEPMPPSEERSEEPARKRPWLVVLIIIVSFVAGAGAVGYWGWRQLENLKAELADVESVTGNQVATLARGQENERKNLIDDVDARMADVDVRLHEFNNSIDTLSTLVVEATQSDPDSLIIAEVDYLLQLANYRIGLEHNRDGALRAVNRAQSRLESLNASAYRPILDQIAADKAALEAVVTADVSAIVGTLAALLEGVDDLGADPERVAPQGESPSPEQRQTTGWDAFVSAFGENLAQFVEVHEADGAAAPTLIPDQEYFARENVRISLQNARASVVRLDAENFRLSLSEARFWLLGHFTVSAATPYMLGEIERLIALELAPVLPDLDASLDLVRELSQLPAVEEVPEDSGEALDESVEIIEEATQ